MAQELAAASLPISRPVAAPSAATAVPRRGISIFVRVLLFGLGVSLLPLGGLGLAMIDVNRRALELSTSQLNLAVALDADRAIRREIERAHQELVGIGQLLLMAGLGDEDERLRLVGTKITASDQFDHVTLYDPKGAPLGTVKAREVAAPPVPPRLDAGLMERATATSLLPVGVRIAPEGPLLDVLQLIHVEGLPASFLMTSLKLTALCDELNRLSESRLSLKDLVMAVDDQRNIVVSGEVSRAVAREPQASKGIFSDARGNAKFSNFMELAIERPFLENGTWMVGAFRTLPELGWAIVVREPRDLAYASLDEMRRRIALALGLAALAATLIAAFIARRLTRPIALLSTATRAIAARKYESLPVAITSRADELGTLGRSFDTMATDLRVSEASLIEETRVRSSLSRYLAPDVVDVIVKNPARLQLGGERREVTVLFADVVAFTRLAENRRPELIVVLLNELFTVATEIVQRRGGIVDKFIGDCVMAVWGAPVPHEDDAIRAVAAAEDLRRWAETANRRWRQRLGIEIQLGMGIHTGLAVAGNLGSEKRMEYTVIGDAVNVAARLESVAQPGQILVSSVTRAKVGDSASFRPAGERTLPGRTKSEVLYEVTD